MGEIYNIPAGIPFAKSLAAKLLTEDKDTLPDILILLPTRRACRTLREAFLQQNAGKPILLPRMQAIGDIDEEELSLSIAGQNGTQNLLDLPPALPAIRRQILLARAIHAAPDFPHNIDHAFSLAKELGQLMDQIYTENLKLTDLTTLVPEDFAAHWQITLDFLKILSETWPVILDNLGMIDAADRRNRLLLTLAKFWRDHPPQTRIIAAGTTGSIPATATLLKTIAGLPNGQIILPGLDEDIDEDSWNALSESHPQYGLKSLLEALETHPHNVKYWSDTDTAHTANRRFLSTQLMRPAATTKHWQTLAHNTKAQQSITSAIRNLNIITCETAQEEAQIIALLMRQILEHPTKTAALITPDRKLAARVATAAKRWNISLDDSAGTPLSQTLHGKILHALGNTCEANIAPVALLTLLKHPFIPYNPAITTLEEHALRGIKPMGGFEGLHKRLETLKCETTKTTLQSFITELEQHLRPLLTLYQSSERSSFKSLLTTHIQTCEALTQSNILWQGEAGNALSTMLANLMDHAHDMPDMHPREYTQILQQFLSAETLRPAYGTHPRLQILGQLEARLIDADLVILGGLNEDTWPPKPSHDPWMSRPMRRDFGLPGSERGIGLAAHDFVQGFCAPKTIITRSKTNDGAPTVPARWLQRLDTVLNAAEINASPIASHPALNWARQIDESKHITPCARPAPKPPAHLRPTKFRITEIETWLKDPYSIYARHVLRLEPLKPLEQDADAALRGQIMHDALEDFITAHPDTLPKNAAQILKETAQHKVTQYDLDQNDWQGFWPRFTEIANAFIDTESAWRETAKPLKSEIKGELNIADAVIYGRADRIDKIGQDYAIIDYKSGGQFSKSKIASGDTPQLAIEGLIAQEGGFASLSPAPCGYLGYWVLNPNGKNTEINDTDDLLRDTHEALETLITTFSDEDTPYHAIPRANIAPRFHDYEHLARVQEWAALDEQEDAA
ncbi:MAG: double-strand break repair protein AddB [Alphaproteobacteria bacterium]